MKPSVCLTRATLGSTLVACVTTVLLVGLSTGRLDGQPQSQCVVSILNRTAAVKPDGSWRVNNVPANLGLVRARFTCVENGITRRGQSKFFTISPNITNGFEPDFSLDNATPVPTNIALRAPMTILTSIGVTSQLEVIGTFPDGDTQDLAASSTGTTYINSTPGVATVSADGLVTAVMTGQTLISAANEGRIAALMFRVTLSEDSDGDGIPDDIELELGLDPNNPIDARADLDADGLTVLEEVNLGTDVLVADTDGDGVNDGLEAAASTDPLNALSVSYAGTGLLASIEVTPVSATLRTNEILPAEACQQLQVTANLITGQRLDITATTTGTTYSSSDLLVVNLSETDGEICAGDPGQAVVQVCNADQCFDVPVTVTSLTPTALGFVPVPGYPNNVDVAGPYAYVAAGSTGLQVVDVADPESPTICGFVDTPGNANDVKVSGELAYVADGASGLQVVDVSDPCAPVICGAVDTPGTASDVIVEGSLAYVADGSTGLQVIDVGDPCAPAIIGSVETPGTAYGVDVDPGRELVVVADGAAGLQVVDVSNPGAPRILGAVDTQPGVDGGLDVVLEGEFALVANGTPVFGLRGGLVSVDTADPTSPRIAGQSPPTESNIWDVASGRGLALCADNFSVNAVHTFLIADPATPVASLLIDFSQEPSFRDDNGTGIALQRGFVYMTGIRGAIQHHGFNGDGGLHIGQYAELTDTAGIPPTVSLVSPVGGDLVVEGSRLSMEAEADDDVGVARVDFLVAGAVAASDAAAPFAASVTVPLGPGPLFLGAHAVDFGGNTSERDQIGVTVIPDPLTTVIGVVEDEDGNPFLGAEIELTFDPDFNTLSGADGTFMIPDVPTIAGAIRASVSGVLDGFNVVETSRSVAPVLAGVTDLGTITLRSFVEGVRLELFDTTNPVGAVTADFEGLERGLFTVATATGSFTAAETVVPVINFLDGPFDIAAFYNVGPNGVEDAGSTAEAPVGDDISIIPPGGNDQFVARFTGHIEFPDGGDVTFTVGNDDLFRLTINNEIVAENLVGTDFREFTGTANLPAGIVPFTLLYGELGGEANIVLSAEGGGLPGGVIPPEFLLSRPERTPPRVVGVLDLRDELTGAIAGFVVNFDERMDCDTIDGAMRLFCEGPDGVPESADDVEVLTTAFCDPDGDGTAAFVIPLIPLFGGRYRVVVDTTVSDLKGNRLEERFTHVTFVVDTLTNVLSNPSFESGADPGNFIRIGVGSEVIDDWIVVAGPIDYVESFWLASDGNRSVDMNGDAFEGGIAQTFATVAGQEYLVLFDMAGNPGVQPRVQEMAVEAAGQSADFSFEVNGTDRLNNMGWVTKQWSFTATDATTTIQFRSLNTQDQFAGPTLDNVRVAPARDCAGN